MIEEISDDRYGRGTRCDLRSMEEKSVNIAWKKRMIPHPYTKQTSISKDKHFNLCVLLRSHMLSDVSIAPMSGDITAMPGLPGRPAALDMDIEDGKIKGLF